MLMSVLLSIGVRESAFAISSQWVVVHLWQLPLAAATHASRAASALQRCAVQLAQPLPCCGSSLSLPLWTGCLPSCSLRLVRSYITPPRVYPHPRPNPTPHPAPLRCHGRQAGAAGVHVYRGLCQWHLEQRGALHRPQLWSRRHLPRRRRPVLHLRAYLGGGLLVVEGGPGSAEPQAALPPAHCSKSCACLSPLPNPKRAAPAAQVGFDAISNTAEEVSGHALGCKSLASYCTPSPATALPGYFRPSLWAVRPAHFPPLTHPCL